MYDNLKKKKRINKLPKLALKLTLEHKKLPLQFQRLWEGKLQNNRNLQINRIIYIVFQKKIEKNKAPLTKI